MVVGATRDLQLVHRMRVQAFDRLDADDALVLGLVRQHRRPGDVTDRIDARYVGFAEVVDLDDAALELYAELFEANVLDIADDADGGDDAIDGDLLAFVVGLNGGGDAVGLLVELGDFGVRHDLHALLLELLAGDAGDLGILHRQDLRQHFNHGHLGAHGAI